MEAQQAQAETMLRSLASQIAAQAAQSAVAIAERDFEIVSLQSKFSDSEKEREALRAQLAALQEKFVITEDNPAVQKGD